MEKKMRSKGNLKNRSAFKQNINILSICMFSLMMFPIQAEDKTEADINAATAGVEANNGLEVEKNKSNESDIATDKIKDAADVAAAIAAFGLPTKVIVKSEKVVEEIPVEITAAVEKNLISRIEINKPEIDPIASEIFRQPIYYAKPLLKYFTVVEGEVIDLSYRGSNAILAGYLKLLRDDFVLDSVEKASLLGKAFQPAFPFKRSKEFEAPVKLKNGWLLIRDEFFKNHSGLVFTTDENGKITLIEYVLKINPKDFSYKPPTAITL